MSKLSHILLVEDNIMDVQLAQEACAEVDKNILLHVVRGGQEAIDYLFGQGEYTNRGLYPLPGIILLDLKMPDIGGLEVLRRIKSTPILQSIPVIILTSSKERQDLKACYEAGANSYLVKPVSYDYFVGTLKGINDYWFTLNVPMYEIAENNSE